MEKKTTSSSFPTSSSSSYPSTFPNKRTVIVDADDLFRVKSFSDNATRGLQSVNAPTIGSTKISKLTADSGALG